MSKDGDWVIRDADQATAAEDGAVCCEHEMACTHCGYRGRVVMDPVGDRLVLPPDAFGLPAEPGEQAGWALDYIQRSYGETVLMPPDQKVYQLYCWCCGQKAYPDDAVVSMAGMRIYHSACGQKHLAGVEPGHICVADR